MNMFNMLIYLLIILMIPMILLTLNLFLSKKKSKNREKISPFECGFDPMSNPRIPFSIQFFLISLMFLIFDIEISLLIPLIPLMTNYYFFMPLSFFIFMLILLICIYFEYMENMIEWKN